MKSKKLLSVALSLCILGTSSALFSVNAKAETNTPPTPTTTVVSPMLVGTVKITSTSGANIRSGAGTNYSIIGTANYGAELAYNNKQQQDSFGVTWYQVAYGSRLGWVSSQVSVLG